MGSIRKWQGKVWNAIEASNNERSLTQRAWLHGDNTVITHELGRIQLANGNTVFNTYILWVQFVEPINEDDIEYEPPV